MWRWDSAALASGCAEQLDRELAGRRDRPRIVLLGHAGDPLPPLPAIQAEVGRVVEVLAKHGVIAWLATRGTALPHLRSVLVAHRDFVRVSVSLLSEPLDDLAAVVALVQT